jgi:hypothetical protein
MNCIPLEQPIITLQVIENSQPVASTSSFSSENINNENVHELLELILMNAQKWSNFNVPDSLIIKDEFEFAILQQYREFRHLKNINFCEKIVNQMKKPNISKIKENITDCKALNQINDFVLPNINNKSQQIDFGAQSAKSKFKFFNKKPRKI